MYKAKVPMVVAREEKDWERKGSHVSGSGGRGRMKRVMVAMLVVVVEGG